jgi:hypothetical protein
VGLDLDVREWFETDDRSRMVVPRSQVAPDFVATALATRMRVAE